jgi:hypothetical protein
MGEVEGEAAGDLGALAEVVADAAGGDRPLLIDAAGGDEVVRELLVEELGRELAEEAGGQPDADAGRHAHRPALVLGLARPPGVAVEVEGRSSAACPTRSPRGLGLDDVDRLDQGAIEAALDLVLLGEAERLGREGLIFVVEAEDQPLVPPGLEVLANAGLGAEAHALALDVAAGEQTEPVVGAVVDLVLLRRLLRLLLLAAFFFFFFFFCFGLGAACGSLRGGAACGPR